MNAGFAEMRGEHHRPQRGLDRTAWIAQEIGDASQCLVGLGIENMEDGADQKRARTLCYGCQVRAECLAEALDNRIEWGVWGGMTERERRRLLRKHTEITSWRRLLLQPQPQLAE